MLKRKEKILNFLNRQKYGWPMWFILGLILALFFFLILLYPQFRELRSLSKKAGLEASAYRGLFTGFEYKKDTKWQEKKLEIDWIYKGEKPFKINTIRVSWLPQDPAFKVVALAAREKGTQKERDFFYTAGGATGNNTLIDLQKKINLPDWSAGMYFNSPITYYKNDAVTFLVSTDKAPPSGTVFTFLINEDQDTESSISITTK